MTLLVCLSCESLVPQDAAQCPQCGGSLAADVAERLGRALGPHYEVVRLLGRGGFAEVYEVRDLDLQRRLAVKVLRPDFEWTSGTLARFKQEARSAARLHHPHTVPIHFVGEGEGLVFYAMPYIEGLSLAELLRRDGALAPDRAAIIAIPIVEALAHAHEHGLIHRDIKPDNIMIEAATGRPLLLDFGIAKRLDGGAHQTQSGFVVGTPLYMSPEQALGERNVDARTDIYAIGTVLFQMLTGAPPFNGVDSQEVVSKHLTEPVPVSALAQARIPSWLSVIVSRCMAKQPGDRYPSAAALLSALRAGRNSGASRESAAPVAVRSEPAGPDDPTMQIPAAGRRRRRRRLVAWALGVGAVLVAVSIGTASGWRAGPKLVIENRLLAPVAVSVDDVPLEVVRPGELVTAALPRDGSVLAEWRLVQPISEAGRRFGAQVRGELLLDQPEGKVEWRIGLDELVRRYFTPVIVNGTEVPIRLTIASRGDSTPGCDCLVPPGGTGTGLGYYPLSAGAAIVLTAPDGRRARFDELAPRVERGTGAVRLEIAPTDLIAPPPPAPPRDPAPLATDTALRAPPADAPVDSGKPRPVLLDSLTRDSLTLDSVVADSAAGDSAASDSAPRQNDDLLRGIFPDR